MPVYYTHRNRENLDNKAKRVPDDVLIPFNAGRQITDIKRGLTGQFYNERPSNATSLREWVNEHGRINVYEVADITERDALDDAGSDYLINEGDIAIVADADGLGNPATYIYKENNTWVLLLSSAAALGGGIAIYSPITDLTVRANKLGITASESTGVLNITIPNTVEVYKIDYVGIQSDLDVSNDMTINFNYAWDNGYNKSLATTFMPNVEVWDRTLPTYNGNVVSDNYYIRKNVTDPPEIRITQSASNTLSIKLKDLSMINYWGLSITL